MSDQREYQRAYYDRHYAPRATAVREQLSHPLFRSFYDRLATRMLDLGTPPGVPGDGPLRLFEPGCGEGLLGSALRRAAEKRAMALAYLGADISTVALELARESLDGELAVGDAAAVTASLPEASRDLVVAKNLLHHLDAPADFLAEARRVVSPHGRIVVAEARIAGPQFLVASTLAARRERYLFLGHRRNVEAFRAAGLTVVHTERFSFLPYELAFLIRPRLFRRIFSTDDPRVIARVSAADDRLAAALPWMASYTLVVASPSEAGPASDGGTNRA